MMTLEGRIRVLLVAFTIGLVLSGLTAFPLQWEVSTFARILGASDSAAPETTTGLTHWIVTVRDGLTETNAKYPFLSYGTDWLAFGHLMIAIAFFGAIKDPIRNIWVIEFGMIACVLIIPLAMICGPIRGIPFYWRLVDCSFGVFGIIPLWLARKYTLKLANSCK
ncbi:MAG: hypothetical protein ABFD64_13160 [Armatimonadota bacterium]